MRKINRIYEAITAEQDLSVLNQGGRMSATSPVFQATTSIAQSYDPTDYPDKIPVPNGSERQMVSFDNIIENGEVSSFGDGHRWTLTVDLHTDPPDAYNQNLNTIEERVLDRIENPAESDVAGQRLNELLNQEEPWTMEDREDWEENLSHITSTEAAQLPGFDRYRRASADPENVSRPGSANALNEDIENGTYNIEYDCEYMSLTEGIVLQRVENQLLPEQSTGPDDFRYQGQYYYSGGSVTQGISDPDVGGHAYMVSSVTGNIIEGTRTNNPYLRSSDPDWTFEDTINDRPFMADNGRVYSRHYMSMEESTLARLENGDYDAVYNDMNQDWDEIPADYLPEDYEMSDDMTYMVNLEAQIDQLENAFDDARYQPEHYPAIQARLDELYEERDQHIVTMSVNGTFAEFSQEMEVLQNGENSFEAHKDSIRSRLDTRWEDNLDEYSNEPEMQPDSVSEAGLGYVEINIADVPFPDDYEMSRDMEYILERQRILEDENSTPRERERAEYQIDNLLDAMIEDGSIVEFEQEIAILTSAQSRYGRSESMPLNPLVEAEGTNTIFEPDIIGDNDLDVTELSIQHTEFFQNYTEVVSLDPTQVGTFDSVRLSQMIDQLDMNSISVTDVSPPLQNIIYQLNEIDNFEEALLSDPDNAGLLVGQSAAQDSYINNISHLAEEGELPDIEQEINALNLAQAEQRLRTGEVGLELDQDQDQDTGVTISLPEKVF